MIRGPATLPEHLPNLPIRDGLRVSDVAQVELVPGDSDELSVALLEDGVSDSLLIEVYMQATGTVVEASADLRELLASAAPASGVDSWEFRRRRIGAALRPLRAHPCRHR